MPAASGEKPATKRVNREKPSQYKTKSSMKRLKLSSMLALAILAGGAIGAYAQKTEEGTTFTADIKLPTNAPLTYIEVFDIAQGAASLAISNAGFAGLVDTDGSGKIEGSGFTRLLFPPLVLVINTNTSTTNLLATGVGDYNTTVSGKITTKNNLPSVQASVKGTGYSAVPTNVIVVGGNVVFFRSSANNSSFNVNFTGNSALVIITNGGIPTFNVAGNYKGNIKPGKNVGNGKNIKVDETAILPVDRVQVTDINLQVVKLGNKFWANTIGRNFNGSGNISGSGKATANFKGLGSEKGSSFKLTGQQGNVIIII